MASGALFGTANGRSQNKNLVEFRAGKMYMKGKMVHPDKRKGQVYIYQSEDSLMHFCWKDRTNGNVEDDLIIFPEDVEFKHVTQCTTGRVFVLKFKSSTRKFFLWMQEPKTDKDDDHCKKVNDFLNNPPTPGSSRGGHSLPSDLANLAGDTDIQNILSGMSQQQMMQLLGGMGLGGPGGGLSALMGRPSSAQSTVSEPPLRVQSSPVTRTSVQETTPFQRPVTAAALPSQNNTSTTSGGGAASAGASNSQRQQIQLSDLQNILSNMKDAIWTKEKPDFHDNKEYLLLVMEKLNIIAKPMSYTMDGESVKKEDYYLAPCILRQETPREIICPESDPNEKSTSALCFVSKEKCLPPPIFHRLVGACLTHWPIAKQDEENLIYCGCCLFDIDKYHRLSLHFLGHVIFARVTIMGVSNISKSSKLCSGARQFIYENLLKIIGNLGQSLEFEPHIQCPGCKADSLKGMIAVPELQNENVVVCRSHDKGHPLESQQLLKFWFEDGEQTDETSEVPETVPSTSRNTGPSVDDTDRFVHIACLLVNVGSKVLRCLLLFHTVTPTCTLDQYLANKRIDLDNLRKKRILNKSQMDILFPPSGITSLGDYDITLLSALFTNIVPNISQQHLDMIHYLRDKRNEIFAHAPSVAVNLNNYQTFWNDIYTRLEALSKQCNDPDFEKEISKEIQGIQGSTFQDKWLQDILQSLSGRMENIEMILQNFISSPKIK
ncbi:hypothetical protein ACJMK2_001558 [Sinanodonta woodiana]|uniref:Pru domain-containing protein n=1 Tax=Sinanodonta woodiana TaxID=1069815 RepID=A0ABD3XU81_SINWO